MEISLINNVKGKVIVISEVSDSNLDDILGLLEQTITVIKGGKKLTNVHLELQDTKIKIQYEVDLS